MKKFLGAAWRKVKGEPLVVVSALQAAAAVAAAFGFELTPAQEGAVWALLGVLLGVNVGVRRMVTPVAKVEEAGMRWSRSMKRWERDAPRAPRR